MGLGHQAREVVATSVDTPWECGLMRMHSQSPLEASTLSNPPDSMNEARMTLRVTAFIIATRMIGAPWGFVQSLRVLMRIPHGHQRALSSSNTIRTELNSSGLTERGSDSVGLCPSGDIDK